MHIQWGPSPDPDLNGAEYADSAEMAVLMDIHMYSYWRGEMVLLQYLESMERLFVMK